MLAVISPAKKLDLTPVPPEVPSTAPRLAAETRQLVDVARGLSAEDLARLMRLSPNLAELNFDRFQAFSTSPRGRKGRLQAALTFDGDTYQGLQARQLDNDSLLYAQAHLRILSGLYGLLRPLDLIQPYRLEMGTALRTPRGKNLYDFWGQRIATELNRAAKDQAAVINLSSNEYFSAVQRNHLDVPVVDCVFQEVRDGKPKVISFCAKKARGMMSRYIIEKRLTQPKQLHAFREARYRYVASASSEQRLVFRRPGQ